IREKLDLAAAHPPVFAPGTSYKYSNTDYNLLGLIIERVTGHSWRHEVSRRVIGPLGLSGTSLPPPGIGRCQTRTRMPTLGATERESIRPASTPPSPGPPAATR